MASFSYTARTEAGDLRRGEVEAATRTEAARLIQAHGLFAVALRRKSALQFARRRAADRKYAMVFCRELALMLAAGLAANESLQLLAADAPQKRRAMLSDMARRMAHGSTLAEAMAQHGQVFPPTISSLVRAGEAGGSLEPLLKRLADKEEKSWRVREKLQTALVYPALLALAAVFAVTFIFIFVLPNFVHMLDGLAVELPLPTRLVLGIGSLFERHGGAVLAALFLLPLALRLLYRERRLHFLADRLLLRLPLFGRLRLDLELMTLFDTLAVLMESGSALHEALAASEGVVQNRFLAVLFSRVRREVERGGTLAAALAGSVVPPLVWELVRAGEHTGELAAMLEKAADFCRFAGEMRAERMETMLEPLLVLFLGVIVGTVVLAVALPLLEMIGSYGY